MRGVIEYSAFALGALVSLLNFYLSWIRIPLLRFLGQSPAWKSGLPLVGSLLLVVALILLWDERGSAVVAALFLAIDTGGPHWYLGGWLWRATIGGGKAR